MWTGSWLRPALTLRSGAALASRALGAGEHTQGPRALLPPDKLCLPFIVVLPTVGVLTALGGNEHQLSCSQGRGTE